MMDTIVFIYLAIPTCMILFSFVFYGGLFIYGFLTGHVPFSENKEEIEEKLELEYNKYPWYQKDTKVNLRIVK